MSTHSLHAKPDSCPVAMAMDRDAPVCSNPVPCDVHPAPFSGDKIVDLMAALEASLQAAKDASS